ncbi:hypothetical protein SBOR_0497 [Sclerotinia borealis F-4128]|uniref:Uncharacterized protein n=1 Tax=Sclerotinia borealis (strain F-4128) TaxID=1432307 RepID=W9CQH8_SCLBF|nr:hypothetical protein SBOR_0497 [Sclerotinia borealis F-4128]
MSDTSETPKLTASAGEQAKTTQAEATATGADDEKGTSSRPRWTIDEKNKVLFEIYQQAVAAKFRPDSTAISLPNRTTRAIGNFWGDFKKTAKSLNDQDEGGAKGATKDDAKVQKRKGTAKENDDGAAKKGLCEFKVEDDDDKFDSGEERTIY